MRKAFLISAFTAIIAPSALAQDSPVNTAASTDNAYVNSTASTVYSGTNYATPDYSQRPTAADPRQERCISIMAGFPSDDPVPRYQFLRLTQELSRDAVPDFKAAMSQYGEGNMTDDTPVLDIIEAIANPVLRQAAPELAVANMAHLINFSDLCTPYVDGQIESLKAFDGSLANEDYVIQEDALFLRQVLSDSMFRLGADQDPIHGAAVQGYANSLVVMRDLIEFETYDADIGDIEALYMTDLDGRLARSNDLINSEINRETLGNALVLANDMNEAENDKREMHALQTLFRIMQ